MINTNQNATTLAEANINLFDVNNKLEDAFNSINEKLCGDVIVNFSNMLDCSPNVDEVEKGYACESVMGLYAAARIARELIGDAYRLLNGKELPQ